MSRMLLLLLLCLSVAVPAFGQEQFAARDTVLEVLTSDGVKLHVRVRGTGTPCLYLHGGPGSGSHWLEKFSGSMLERRFRMVYLDQRGVCRSSSPADGNYSLERMVRDCEEVREALGIERWLTLGHSFGGILQVGYAGRRPQAVRGMLMLNTGLCLEECLRTSWLPRAQELLGVTDTVPLPAGRAALLARLGELAGQLQEQDLFWRMGYSSKANKELMDASFGDIPDWNKDQENLMLAVEDYWQDFRPLTRELTMPVLFFYGTSDWMAGPESWRGAEFPELLRWESATGHVPFLENPADLEQAIDSYRERYGF